LLGYEFGQQEIFDKEGTKVHFKFDLQLIIILFLDQKIKKKYLYFIMHGLGQIILKNLS
jgi:hypothetical protein